MHESDVPAILEFLRACERLKVTHRTAYTSLGDPESTAEHTWRLTLMAMLIARDMPVDMSRLLRMCIVHDLGEAIGGDVPAPEQARRAASGEGAKAENERRDLVTLCAPLPSTLRDDILALWDEYEAGATPEAKLAKAFDKLETILQHTQGDNPPDFDHRFNLQYGARWTTAPSVVAEMRAILDAETARLADAGDTRSPHTAHD